MLALTDLRTDPGGFAAAVARPSPAGDRPLEAVRAIVGDVRARGDVALCELTERFDGVALTPGQLRVTADELAGAWEATDPALRLALERAAARVRAYHESPDCPRVFEADGITVNEIDVPVARAGVYVPGGRAAYPSTLLMTAVPAQVAGVAEVVLATPAGPDGSIPQVSAAAAYMLGLTEVYRVGGAQAIAALAYGTATIRPVDVVCGPGNVYVALAKAEVSRDVGVESLAGPSECVVVADAGAPVRPLALDLVAQAEHGPGGFTLLVTWSDDLAAAVQAELELVVAAAPRGGLIAESLRAGGRLVLCEGPEQALEVANAAAAEHLQLMVADPGALLAGVRNAGAVFCGYWTPVTLGDYVAGPSHVLPTGGTARFASALRVADFRKSIHVVTCPGPAALADLGATAAALADAEGLPAHAEAVRARLGDPGGGA